MVKFCLLEARLQFDFVPSLDSLYPEIMSPGKKVKSPEFVIICKYINDIFLESAEGTSGALAV